MTLRLFRASLSENEFLSDMTDEAAKISICSSLPENENRQPNGHKTFGFTSRRLWQRGLQKPERWLAPKSLRTRAEGGQRTSRCCPGLASL